MMTNAKRSLTRHKSELNYLKVSFLDYLEVRAHCGCDITRACARTVGTHWTLRAAKSDLSRQSRSEE
jgi:hypothetical protein